MDLSHIRFEGAGRRARSSIPRTPRARLDDFVSEPPTVGGLPACILQQAGLNPAAYRVAPLERRTAACLRAIRVDAEPRGIERVRREPAIARLALNTLLIGVSEFFRDPAVFHALRTRIVAAWQPRSRPLRILSVGSSSGAELFSVAMLLAEVSLLDRASLVGIDCRADAVRHAMAAIFHEDAIATIPTPLRARYVELVASGWRVVDDLRRHTSWHVVDATRTCPNGAWDMILCRNVAIYLQPRVAEAMFRRLAQQLVPGGVLVVGKAERLPAPLKLTPRERCIYTSHAD